MGKYCLDEVKSILCECGYIYVCGDYEYTTSNITCKTLDGYYVVTSIENLLNRNKKPRIFHVSNPYTINNIKRYIYNMTSGEFDCISNSYNGTKKQLKFRHNICNRTFENSWHNVSRGRYKDNLGTNKTGLFCPHCQTKQLESMHALVLKQIWLHEEPDTVVEDGSCYNPKTGCQLPTDIVNHRLKIAIEIQSWFHDKEHQKEKDAIKKHFWIDNGYRFYAIDHRDYTVIEMIQLFFPNIKEIPDYIDYGYSNKFDAIKAQELLNEYQSVNKVAEIINCNPHKIYDSIHNGLMRYPDEYMKDFYTPVVQLDLNKNFIASYCTMKEASDITGIPQGNISQCLQKGRNYSSGYYWVYKEKYDSGNYTISEYRGAKTLVAIEQYDLDDNFIKLFDTIKEASNETNTNITDIWRVATNERNKANGYIWKFPKNYIIQ